MWSVIVGFPSHINLLLGGRNIDKAFSMIAIDQPYNQYFAVIIAYRATIGLTEDLVFFFSLSSNTS